MRAAGRSHVIAAGRGPPPAQAGAAAFQPPAEARHLGTQSPARTRGDGGPLVRSPHGHGQSAQSKTAVTQEPRDEEGTSKGSSEAAARTEAGRRPGPGRACRELRVGDRVWWLPGSRALGSCSFSPARSQHRY